MAYKRLFRKLTSENLWLYSLRMLMERPMYAYEIAKTIKERFDFSIATITVYVVLYQMEREGLVQVGRRESILGRPDRKYYEVTAKGREMLQRGLDFISEVIKKLS